MPLGGNHFFLHLTNTLGMNPPPIPIAAGMQGAMPRGERTQCVILFIERGPRSPMYMSLFSIVVFKHGQGVGRVGCERGSDADLPPPLSANWTLARRRVLVG